MALHKEADGIAPAPAQPRRRHHVHQEHFGVGLCGALYAGDGQWLVYSVIARVEPGCLCLGFQARVKADPWYLILRGHKIKAKT